MNSRRSPHGDQPQTERRGAWAGHTAPGSAPAKGRVVIAGGTGFLGRSLAKRLACRGYEVVLMSRHAVAGGVAGRRVAWDARRLGDWVEQLDGASALVNLAGRSVDCVKTPDRCDAILRSRVEATRVLGQAIRRVASPPRVWVPMSTAHCYGDSLEVVCDQYPAFGYGLAPCVAREWEGACRDAAPSGTRLVILRTSFVLGAHGGALPRLAGLVRWGLGGRVGHGRQGISWIHQRDMNRLFERAIADDGVRGAYLATAPNPVSNAEFMRELRRALRVPVGLPAARWMVRIGAPLVMRTDPDLALYGRYCCSRRLEQEGFEFNFPRVAAALQNLYGAGRDN